MFENFESFYVPAMVKFLNKSNKKGLEFAFQATLYKSIIS